MAFSQLISSTSKWVVLLIFLTAGADQLYSQSADTPFSISHSAHSVSNTPISDGTLHIVAAMVEFQPDTTRFTSGDGTFAPGAISYLQNESITIDPLPHDQAYFEAHLEFAKNYFSKMSDGELSISYQVLDDIYRLPQRMASYSPVGVDPDSDPLADLARDAWEQVAASGDLNLGLNSSDQIAFVLFHAGVGRDIELTGTTLDKTPQDIPSVYISRNAFARLFDDPSFSGFPIDSGNLIVDNTMILPRTLTRSGEDVTGAEILLQLSINGMVTAQIGSHIGLPDLFNTETGESGIGRFGLMDGAGIFAYNGLFPPELSAWEKMHMGWAEPFEIDYNRSAPITLPASSLGQPGSIAKVLLSSREYFLIENRHREADQTGTTLTIRQPDGSTTTQTFTNSDTTFVFQLSDFSDEILPGVVTNVSNYDFALPGGPADVLEETGDNDDRILNGGMLIWHIDESIIQNRLAANRGINDDPLEKGVKLMEADGAQDIGRPTAIGFFENEVNGSAFDFWWSGNDASVITATQTITLYENRFGPDTTPDNDSNSGAEAQFELFDFSDNLPVSSVSIREFSPESSYEVVEFLQGLPLSYSTPTDNPYWTSYPLSTLMVNSGQDSFIVLPGNDGLSLYNLGQNSLLPSQITGQSVQQPLASDDTGSLLTAPNPALEPNEYTLRLFDVTAGGVTQTSSFSPSLNQGLISSPVPNFVQLDGTSDRIRPGNDLLESDFYGEDAYRSAQISGYESTLSTDGSLTIITPGETYSGRVPMPSTSFGRVHTALIERQDGGFDTFVLSGSDLLLFDTSRTTESGEIQPELIHRSEQIGWPALVDADQSGDIDFLFVDEVTNQLIAKNRNGAILSGFPVDAPQNSVFKGSPVISDINSDGVFDILIAARTSGSMTIFAFSADGSRLEGLPLLVGSYPDESQEIINPSFRDGYLSAVSPEGDFRIWQFPDAQNTQWESRYGNGNTNKLTGRLPDSDVQQPAFTVLNDQETYNWPNPASDETYIRFQTSDPGTVQIKISTTSGRLVYNETHASRGGAPEEIRIDTSVWGSGGYLAMVEATVNGETERKLVKIAVAQ